MVRNKSLWAAGHVVANDKATDAFAEGATKEHPAKDLVLLLV